MIARWRSPLDVFRHRKRVQYGALPYRFVNGDIEVLLVTSRSSGKWIVPKGWPGIGMTPAQSAAREAMEEAGAIGQPDTRPLGTFPHVKSLNNLAVEVEVYPLLVSRELADWDERGQRKREWFFQAQAAEAVSNPKLSILIRDWVPDEEIL